jgi:Vitamin B6 photo-protection and homoeostasis
MLIPGGKVVVHSLEEHVSGMQRFCSQMNMMFATQSLLYALGIGATKSLPAGAAINWMLKEGLGKLARMTIATSFAKNFDSQVKVRKSPRCCTFCHEFTCSLPFVQPQCSIAVCQK